MRASYDQIACLVRRVKDVPGDFAELGVWHGDTFVPLAEAAQAAGRGCHAVDSFRGMGEPTAKDYDEDGGCAYPEGVLSVGGSEAFRELVARFGSTVHVYEGPVPDILDAIGDIVLAFSHLDMDQYMPTRLALDWVWDRTAPGGIVCCHDWMYGRNCLAPAAIREWMQASGVEMAGTSRSGHCWFLKEDIHEHP